MLQRETDLAFHVVYGRVGQVFVAVYQVAFDGFGGGGQAMVHIHKTGVDAPVFIVFALEYGDLILIHPIAFFGAVAQRKIAVVGYQWHYAYRVDIEVALHKIVYLLAGFNGRVHLAHSITDDQFYFLQRVIVFDDFFIGQLYRRDIRLCQPLREGLLQRVFALFKLYQVVVVENQVR